MHQDRAVALSCSNRLRSCVLPLIAALTLSGCAGFGTQPTDSRGGYARGDKVTAILPGTGPVADAAEAVREGLRAAHAADDTAAKPTLGFIASEQPGTIAAAHAQAVAAGATQVIGPLLKPAVDALAVGPALKVPTLALNQATSPGKSAGNLYQFALDPEAEAVDAANKAKAMGLNRALILAPEGEAGQRRTDAFRRQWDRLGGTLVGQTAFKPAAADYTKTLDGLLGKGQAEVLFLAADADQVRTLYPAIRERGTLPVIATSAVYSGAVDPVRDKALAGLYFVDLPWVLGVGTPGDPVARANLKRGGSAPSTALGLKLYAMGIDAYRLAPRLAALAQDPAATFPGATGTLSIDSLGRVQRQLTLGQFTEGGVRPVVGPLSAESSARPTPSQRVPTAVAQPAPAAVPAAKGPRPEPAVKRS